MSAASEKSRNPKRSTLEASLAKRLEVSEPQVAVHKLVRRALKARLTRVFEELRRTGMRSRPSAEDVHQLRVATRRATAALDTFEDCLPKKRRQRLRKHLRNIRQAASTIRDLDIVVISQKQNGLTLKDADRRRLRRRISRCRRQEQKALRKLTCRRQRRRFRREAKQLVRRTRWRGSGAEPSFSAAAQLLLGPAVEKFFQSAATTKWQTASLHRLRISTKRLRYTLELVRPAIEDAALEAVYPELSEIQRRLGDLNDRAMSRSTYERWLAETSHTARRQLCRTLIDAEESRLEAEIKSFRAWWSPQRQHTLKRKFAELETHRRTAASLAESSLSRDKSLPDTPPDGSNQVSWNGTPVDSTARIGGLGDQPAT